MPDGKKTGVAALLNEIALYRDFLVRTGGGVTATGGEPLAQPEFVTALFQAARRSGLHTALDTSGFSSARTPRTRFWPPPIWCCWTSSPSIPKPTSA